MLTAEIQLTEEQQVVVDKAVEAVETRTDVFRIGGYAGTGKTTVAKYVEENLDGGMVCAFTGKAANRLREKGLPCAATVHSTIYDYDPADNEFHLKPGVDGEYFLIDEGSMISEQLWQDLLYFQKPILLLGDPGQLQPVGKDPRLMHKCDVVLEKIHRQAALSGIVQFATDIRRDNPVGCYDDVAISSGKPTIGDLRWADISICGFNRSRLKINDMYRQLYGYDDLLHPGEQIVILQNNRRHNVFNGQILTIDSIDDEDSTFIYANCKIDDDLAVRLPLFKQQLGHKPMNIYHRNTVLADYGYCITCHKSQGSEWDKVLVIDEQCPKYWEAKRWRYTAVTRAAKEVRYYE